MKKVLILSYFFPPCNLTASQRAGGWAAYLHESGYYPIIVTRNWDVPIHSPQDLLQGSGKEIRHEKNENYEVYYLPYKANLRDRLYSTYGDSRFNWLRKALTFGELAFQNFWLRAVPFRNLYTFAKNLLKSDQEVKKFIVTANPFIMFHFGYLLNKKFNIPWIVDYRDDWNTDEVGNRKGTLQKFLSAVEKKSERKWVGSAGMITSVSSHYVHKISEFVNVPGEVLYNGFFEQNESVEEPLYEDFTITYNGSLYDSQPVEIFLDGVKKLIASKGSTVKLKILFPGLAYDSRQAARVQAHMKGFEQYIHITSRINQQEVLTMQRRSHLLLMIAHKNIKGIPSSKLFEYISLRKPILSAPSDKDIIDKVLKETNLGMFADTAEEVYIQLSALYSSFEDKTLTPPAFDEEAIMQYSRRKQAKKLAELLDRLH